MLPRVAVELAAVALGIRSLRRDPRGDPSRWLAIVLAIASLMITVPVALLVFFDLGLQLLYITAA
jgi:hypothetical protein